MDPAETARSYLAAFGAGDAVLIASHVTEDFVNIQVAELGQGCRTRAVYRERLKQFLADMVGLTYDVEDIVAEGNAVMVAYRLRCRWKGEVDVDIRGVQHLVVADGLIQQRTDYWDSTTFLRQVGSD